MITDITVLAGPVKNEKDLTGRIIFGFAGQVREISWHIWYEDTKHEYPAAEFFFEGIKLEKLKDEDRIEEALRTMVNMGFSPISDETLRRKRYHLKPETKFRIDANKILIDFLFRLGQTTSIEDMAIKFCHLFNPEDLYKEINNVYCSEKEKREIFLRSIKLFREGNLEQKLEALETMKDFCNPLSVVMMIGAINENTWFIRRSACRIAGIIAQKAYKEDDLLTIGMLQAMRPILNKLMDKAIHYDEDWQWSAIGAAACWADDIIDAHGESQGHLILCRKGCQGPDSEKWI